VSAAAARRADRPSLFEAALEVLPDIVLIHDEELILFANAACREFLAAGLPEDLEGRPIDTIIHPDAYASGREQRRLLLDNERCMRGIPLKVIALDGQTKHVTVDAHPITFNGFSAGMVVAHAVAV
jgi:PAS domain S-box-containing protein